MLIFIYSCDENPHDVDVSKIDADVHIQRLDQEWFEMTPVSFRKNHPRYLQEFPELYTAYVETVLELGKVSDSNLFTSIRSFVTSPEIAEVHDSVAIYYADLTETEQELNELWKHYLYYFPDQNIPVHVSFIGGFSTLFAMTENEVGIGIEMFLGRNCRFYEYLQLPRYLRQRMTKKHLAPWLMKNWLETEYPMIKEEPTLLDQIIWEGKVLYALDALIPNAEDSLKVAYTGQQMIWAKEHEPMVWAHFIDKDLLFSTDRTTIGKFTNDGPFTVDLVKESPPRMGHYLGWQIVRAYMAEQDTINLKALFEEQDVQKILKQSKYKP